MDSSSETKVEGELIRPNSDYTTTVRTLKENGFRIKTEPVFNKYKFILPNQVQCPYPFTHFGPCPVASLMNDGTIELLNKDNEEIRRYHPILERIFS